MNMSDRDIFKKELTEKIRKRFLTEDAAARDTAMDIITEEIFTDSRSLSMDNRDIGRFAEEIYLLTKGRFGILDPLIDDPDVNEIMVNGPEKIFFEKGSHVIRYDMCFDSSEELEEVMRSIAGQVHREINELNPIVDARLPDGSRVNGVYKNVAVNGPILTIRKFSDSYITMKDLTSNGTMSEAEAVFLRALVVCGYNLFISGGTSSGKTTLLNALSESIPDRERVIVIEDSMELKLSHIDNIVHMECRNANSQGKGLVTMSDLIKSSLRMRPDRIIVGEVRGGEVVEMLQAMNTGHPGSMSTGHGNSCEGMLKRLEAMYLMAVSLDIEAIRSQIAEGIDVIIHVEKDADGRRRIKEMKEIVSYTDKKYHINDLYDPEGKGITSLKKALQKGEEYAEILRNGPCGRSDHRQDLL